jgi:hypothetical protein
MTAPIIWLSGGSPIFSAAHWAICSSDTIGCDPAHHAAGPEAASRTASFRGYIILAAGASASAGPGAASLDGAPAELGSLRPGAPPAAAREPAAVPEFADAVGGLRPSPMKAIPAERIGRRKIRSQTRQPVAPARRPQRISTTPRDANASNVQRSTQVCFGATDTPSFHNAACPTRPL